MGVKCLAQEHNAVPRPGLEPGPSDPESSALTIRPPRQFSVLDLESSGARPTLTRITVLFSWARHVRLIVPLSIQVFK